MALRIRRGTDAERQTVVFAEGELVYTTDTKELYIGDGATFGGILVSQTEDTPTPPGGITSIVEDTSPQLGGNLDLNNREIFGVGSIDITGSITADVINSGLFVGDGSGLTNIPGGDGIVEGSDYRINIVGNDSSIIVNSSTNTVTGIFNGSILLEPTTDVLNIVNPVKGQFSYDNVSENLSFYDGGTWYNLVKTEYLTNFTVLKGPLSVGKATTAQRDFYGDDSTLLSGGLFYNSTEDRFQIFQAGSWVSLPNNGTDVGQVLVWNGTEWTATDPSVVSGTVQNADLLDGFSGSFYLDYNNFTNTPTLPIDGGVVLGADYRINIVGNDSTLIVDSTNNIVQADIVKTNNLASDDNIINISSFNDLNTESQTVNIISNKNRSILKLSHKSDIDITNDNSLTYGGIFFKKSDSVGDTVTSAIIGRRNSLLFVNDPQGLFNDPLTVVSWTNSNFGIGTNAPTKKLDVHGETIIRDNLTLVNSLVNFSNLTTEERDLKTPVNGSVIYNSTTNKFQGYADGQWIDLH